MNDKEKCKYCTGEWELQINDNNYSVTFDVEKLKKCNEEVNFCPACGRRLNDE